ncbi:FAD-dependent oxidoreductase [Duganella sp. FT92W]|uniref:FAD-dependent oxidoreductase n=1 Tax=Pseudoduganella rivuli TaxID=2666085 RepID=A0A7X2IUY1_9BURK|nr:FAD-dependent oxidoreductase [Pseudoduganella rivuli]MRV76414.1 FAD-dependent oxidoreductase [Pseudoduganella rivuli]
MARYETPAVVLGGGLNALGIVRSLGSAGVPVIVVDSDPTAPAMRSRHGRKVQCQALEGEPLFATLDELARGFGKPVPLFLTEEKTVVSVSEQRERLAGRYLVRLPEHERLLALMHKQGFQELAEACHSAVPRAVRLAGLEDLPKIEALTYPCVLKPSEKSYEYGAKFKKAYKMMSAEEAAKQYREIHPVLADMIVQEWIEGSDSEIYFCLQYIGADGEPCASFTGRKIRSWPPRIGGTASCTAAWEEDRELAAMTTRFFRDVGFTGMGSMEYKRDLRDNKFYMVEPTVARTDFQEEVASINGVNLPLAAYCYELGLPQAAPQKPAVPRIWRDPQADRWSQQESQDGPDARSQSHAIYDAYFRWNDPVPGIDLFVHRVKSKLGLAG